MTYTFHTANTPTPGDPEGMSPNGDGVPGTLPARLVSDDGETLTVAVRNAVGVEVTLSGVREGDQPGEVLLRSRLSKQQGGALAARLRAIVDAKETPPTVSAAARATLAIVAGDNPRQVAAELLGVAENGRRSVEQRAVALAFVAILGAGLRADR